MKICYSGVVYFFLTSTICRPVLTAVETFQDMDPVAWVFKADDESAARLRKDLKSLVSAREKCSLFIPILKALSGCLSAMPEKSLWGGDGLLELLSDVEARRMQQ